jgi:hypothetical protein
MSKKNGAKVAINNGDIPPCNRRFSIEEHNREIDRKNREIDRKWNHIFRKEGVKRYYELS